MKKRDGEYHFVLWRGVVRLDDFDNWLNIPELRRERLAKQLGDAHNESFHLSFFATLQNAGKLDRYNPQGGRWRILCY